MSTTKYLATILFCCLLTKLLAQTNPQPLRIAFDVSSSDTKVHENVIRHVKGVIAKVPSAEIVVIVYGPGVSFVQKNSTTLANDFKSLSASKVSFKVCQITLTNKNIDPSSILDEVTITPDGIIELATLQQQGFAYIKESN
jgi:intracellular sulfur oxidation DsrE/DsrF family protein